MRRISPPNIVKNFIHRALDLLFLRRCYGCQKDGIRLCSNCLAKIPRSFCSGEDKIFSVFDYSSPIVKQAIWALKYKRALDLAETFAPLLIETLLEELADTLLLPPDLKRAQGLAGEAKIILIPAPLSKKRFRQRGYNQAEELARAMSKLRPEQFELRLDLVHKIKDTPSQVSLRDRAKRLANLKGAFEVNASCEVAFRAHLKNDFSRSSPAEKKSYFAQLSPTSLSTGKIFVIIDDVSTTGSTIGEIRRLLQKAGFPRVYGLVLAHG